MKRLVRGVIVLAALALVGFHKGVVRVYRERGVITPGINDRTIGGEFRDPDGNDVLRWDVGERCGRVSDGLVLQSYMQSKAGGRGMPQRRYINLEGVAINMVRGAGDFCDGLARVNTGTSAGGSVFGAFPNDGG